MKPDIVKRLASLFQLLSSKQELLPLLSKGPVWVSKELVAGSLETTTQEQNKQVLPACAMTTASPGEGQEDSSSHLQAELTLNARKSFPVNPANRSQEPNRRC